MNPTNLLLISKMKVAIKDQNYFFRSIPNTDWTRFEPNIEKIYLTSDRVLVHERVKMSHFYFPVSSIISISSELESGKSTEIALIGNEGVLGVTAFMGGSNNNNVATVKTEGLAYRINAKFLQLEFRQNFLFRQLVLKYVETLICQMSQMAVCNRHHLVEQQLCRFLLSCLDRSSSTEITVKQEQISTSLGVRRESVTEAARKIQDDGIIEYTRGKIKVLNQLGLKKRACECYDAISSEYHRLLPGAINSSENKDCKYLNNITPVMRAYSQM